MSYVLDGIKTAMVKGVDRAITCSCGWRCSAPAFVETYGELAVLVTDERLRFHYTHCPQAKVAPEAEMREAFYTPAAYFARHPKP